MQRPTLTFGQPGDIRFPATCAECGAAPSNGYRLRGKLVDVRVPLCREHDGRATLGIALWVVGVLTAAGVLVFSLATLLDAVAPLPTEMPARRNVAMVIAIALMVAAALFVYAGLRRSAALFHRLRSPVFLVAEAPQIVLAFRNASLAAATRSLLEGAQPGYRQPPPATYVPPKLPSYVGPIAVTLWGLGTVGAAFARFAEARKQTGTLYLRSVEIVFYELGGPAGLLVMYLLVAALLTTGGLAWLHVTRKARATLLAGG